MHFITSRKESTATGRALILKKMANCGTWVTHLEKNTATGFLQMFVATMFVHKGQQHLELYKPLFMEPALS